MKAQEWLDAYDKRTIYPRTVALYETEAAAIIRAQQERIERLEAAMESALRLMEGK